MFSQNEELYISLITGFILILFVTCVFILSVIRYKRKTFLHLNEKLQLQTQFDQALLQTKIEIQEQTLKNISQEIHDNIGQVLSLAKLNLNSFPTIEDDVIQTKLNDTKQLVSKALNDLRDLSRSMHGDKIAELGLQASLQAELKILQNTGHFITNLYISAKQYKLDPQTEMVLFRMVQEALNNAVKHSQAKNIEVQLQYDPMVFRLSVTDNGVGFNPDKLRAIDTGIGLKNMQNRAALIGADFTLDSNLDHGTKITIELKNLTP